MTLITGHNHYQPKAPDAPIEFDFCPGDAEFVANAVSGVEALRRKNAAEAAKREAA